MFVITHVYFIIWCVCIIMIKAYTNLSIYYVYVGLPIVFHDVYLYLFLSIAWNKIWKKPYIFTAS